MLINNHGKRYNLMILNMDSTLVRNDDLLDSPLDSETVLLSIKSSKYYGMDQTGSRIWEILQKPVKVEAIIAILTAEYDVTRDECKLDVLDFLGHLKREGLVKHI